MTAAPHSPAPEIQAAALGLLNRLTGEQLAERVFLVLSFASAPSAGCAAPRVRWWHGSPSASQSSRTSSPAA